MKSVFAGASPVSKVLSAVCVVAVIGTAYAEQAAADEDNVTWAVQPANHDGPDGRRSVEVELDPGEKYQDQLVVRNFSENEATFTLNAADGYITDQGRFNTLPSDQPSKDAGTWIDIDDEVEVPGRGETIVPYAITVPDNAEPGDHAAGISASLLNIKNEDDGTQVGVESRVGFRATVQVSGEIQPGLEIVDIDASYETAWNPFQPGNALVGVEVRNTGNTRYTINGKVNAGSGKADLVLDGNQAQELLPGDTRSLSVRVNQVWPLFRANTDVAITATDDEDTPQAQAAAHKGMLAIPWPQIAALAGVLLIILALLWNRDRSQNRLNTMLSQAREEGRRAALKDEND